MSLIGNIVNLFSRNGNGKGASRNIDVSSLNSSTNVLDILTTASYGLSGTVRVFSSYLSADRSPWVSFTLHNGVVISSDSSVVASIEDVSPHFVEEMISDVTSGLVESTSSSETSANGDEWKQRLSEVLWNAIRVEELFSASDDAYDIRYSWTPEISDRHKRHTKNGTLSLTPQEVYRYALEEISLCVDLCRIAGVNSRYANLSFRSKESAIKRAKSSDAQSFVETSLHHSIILGEFLKSHPYTVRSELLEEIIHMCGTKDIVSSGSNDVGVAIGDMEDMITPVFEFEDDLNDFSGFELDEDQDYERTMEIIVDYSRSQPVFIPDASEGEEIVGLEPVSFFVPTAGIREFDVNVTLTRQDLRGLIERNKFLEETVFEIEEELERKSLEYSSILGEHQSYSLDRFLEADILDQELEKEDDANKKARVSLEDDGIDLIVDIERLERERFLANKEREEILSGLVNAPGVENTDVLNNKIQGIRDVRNMIYPIYRAVPVSMVSDFEGGGV